MIVSTPLNLPKLEPTSWEIWWEIWKQAERLTKRYETHNVPGAHFGFDVYKHPNFQPTYTAKLVDLEKLDPGLYNQIMGLPIKIYCARFVQSRADFTPHADNLKENWAIRSMFYGGENQWYYTNMEGTDRKELRLPPSTNWWAYLDGAIKHGTTYVESEPKIILQLFTHPVYTKRYIESMISAFPEYVIEYD